jgi:4,5-dihydroxyphthalate decarboxylase
VQRDYFRRTGIFPIMHTVAVKRELVDKNPWIPQTLANAFGAAKRLAEADLRDTTTLPITLPFLGQHVEETVALMGEDYWPYGVEANRTTLEAFMRYSQRQGLIETAPAVDDLFPASTRVISRI